MPQRSRLMLIATVGTLLALGLALVLVLSGRSGSATREPSSSPSSTPTGSTSQEGFDGAALPAGVKAPGWTLKDRRGRLVTLSQYRGQVVILAFLSPTATGASPLIAQQIRGALDDLAHAVPVVAISADPALDTPTRIRRFLAQTSLTGRLSYLSGTRTQLRPIWRAYRVVPLSAGAGAFERTANVLLIDRRGDERVLFGVEQLTPESLAHDIERLRGSG